MLHRMKRRTKFFFAVGWSLLALTGLAACAGGSDIASRLTPYRMDIRQGNFVSQDMVAQLKPGLSKEQVRFILGTPLVNDMFHADRWDYVYRFQPGSGAAQQRRLSLYFKDGRLERAEGDVVAAQAPAPAAAKDTRAAVSQEQAAGSRQQPAP